MIQGPLERLRHKASRMPDRYTGMFLRLRDLLLDKRGVGGVEFALVAPMLLVLYLMSFELTMGFSVAKKTSMASSAVADIVAREEKVTKSLLVTMPDVAKAIFVPYPTNNLLIKVTAIKIDSTKAAKVAWSWSSTGVVPYAVGTTPPVPADLLVADTFLIRSELSVSHELMTYLPGLVSGGKKSLTLYREFYYRQRLGTEITCSDC
jgi:Flp pilus assembly protein TadG